MPRTAHKGVYSLKNPEKYKGKNPIVYRSTWELTVFQTFDNHPGVVEWASESVRIPYKHPFKGNITSYVPDLLVRMIDKNGKEKIELIEVKPAKEALTEMAKSKYDQAQLIVNMAKWEAARKFCKKNGITFRVLTEFDIYHQGKGKK